MDLTSAEFKKIARNSMAGNWGRLLPATIVAAFLGAFCTIWLFLGVFGGITVFIMEYYGETAGEFLFLGLLGTALALLYFFVGGAVRLGYLNLCLAALDRRKVRAGYIFSKFSLFWKAIYMKVALFLVKFLYTLLLIVPGIVSSFSLAMTPYILEEKPDYSVGKAMRMSKKIMKGHKWQLFSLRLSFLGWYLLAFFTCGLACLYVTPYRHMAEAVFYNEISGRADVYYGRA